MVTHWSVCHNKSSSGARLSAYMWSLDWEGNCKHFTGHAQTFIYLCEFIFMLACMEAINQMMILVKHLFR